MNLDFGLLAGKLHKISKGYPVLLSAIICAIKDHKLDVDVVMDKEWFVHWYERVYFVNYFVPALKMFKALISRRSESAINDAIQKLIKQIRMTIVGDSLLLEQMLEEEAEGSGLDEDGELGSIAQSTIDQMSQSLK